MQPFDPNRAAQLSAMKAQEQQIYAHAKGALSELEPRLEITVDCLDRIQAGLTEHDSDREKFSGETITGIVTLLMTILDVQRLQLEQAKKEAETGISNFKRIISQIEAKVRPGYLVPPTGGVI